MLISTALQKRQNRRKLIPVPVSVHHVPLTARDRRRRKKGDTIANTVTSQSPVHGLHLPFSPKIIEELHNFSVSMLEVQKKCRYIHSFLIGRKQYRSTTQSVQTRR